MLFTDVFPGLYTNTNAHCWVQRATPETCPAKALSTTVSCHDSVKPAGYTCILLYLCTLKI